MCAAGLQDRLVREASCLAGPILHSLVLGRPGQDSRPCFDVEENLLCEYFGMVVFTVKISEAWQIDCGSTKVVTLIKKNPEGPTRLLSLQSHLGFLPGR